MKCLTENSKQLRRLFLMLPDLLYSGDSPQSVDTEKKILTGTHPLSGNMQIHPFVVVGEDGQPISRAILTCYAQEKTGYVGFFESRDNAAAVQLLFDTINGVAAELGLERLMGPINCSIYIGYRFKTNCFDDYFTGEPYNKDYYPALWERAGFRVCDRYWSYRLRRTTAEDSDERLERIYRRCLERGYVFSSLNRKDFSDCLKQIYTLMNRAYSGFSGFQPISQTQFCRMFSYMKYVVDFDMVKLAHRDGQLKAFCICVPNYADMTLGKMTVRKLLRFLKLRRDLREYVIMYLGADETAAGIGSALVHEVQKAICRKQCTSLAALMKDGSLSAKFYAPLHQKRYDYLLYSKPVTR